MMFSKLLTYEREFKKGMLTTKEQLDILRSLSCYCTRTKKNGHALCRDCFAKLTKSEQDSLFIRIPGFGESYERCLARLEERRARPGQNSPRYVDPRKT